ncbi:hypothetical protein BKN38_09150 [Helicobacter sp. CLO-3]|uniref:RNA-binding S4 domain-containing protein n=1 Tax=unclassified Helicobacter TaxID=2593540 RepID=UPI0008047E2F|nr:MULTISPECIES: RNA-binding S4 domain-containing protein [unclassified Helicobacter]OBV28736.1 hypothetical protein BA723_08240 [Helicobacter sp. CLO-3]OHU81388.1 hypothetical protein BKN38_09150 [Helicobacter sp. CLO-3]
MRIDVFLNATNIVKTRSIAQDMCQNSVVKINGAPAKSAKEVKIGDEITLNFLEYDKKYKILALPATKTTPKSQMHLYVEEIKGT